MHFFFFGVGFFEILWLRRFFMYILMFWPCTLELIKKYGAGVLLHGQKHTNWIQKILLQNCFDYKYCCRLVPFLSPFIIFLYYFYCSSFWSHSLNHVPIRSEVFFLLSTLFSFNIFILLLQSFKAFIFLSMSFPQCTQENKHRCHLYSILKIPWRHDASQLSAKPHRRNTS